MNRPMNGFLHASFGGERPVAAPGDARVDRTRVGGPEGPIVWLPARAVFGHQAGAAGAEGGLLARWSPQFPYGHPGEPS